MKKSIAVIAMIAIMSSCNKSQTCTCDTTTSGGQAPVQHSVINTPKQTKKQAKKGLCASYTEKVDNVTIVRNCKLD